ncbi:hypothetical protein L2E82_50843 [Cichorium intybus]|nr:hypothetical protein L2E82_50843 [Cichorium intybus]
MALNHRWRKRTRKSAMPPVKNNEIGRNIDYGVEDRERPRPRETEDDGGGEQLYLFVCKIYEIKKDMGPTPPVDLLPCRRELGPCRRELGMKRIGND